MYKIYILKCPISGEIRYVGQTKTSLQKRLNGHIYVSRKYKVRYTHKDNWILKILKLNLKPVIEKIEEFEINSDMFSILERETHWILKFKSEGVNLLNSTNGGEFSINNRKPTNIKSQSGENNAMWGKSHTNQTKSLMSKAKSGIYNGINNPMAKPVYQYDINLLLLKKWDFAKACSDVYKISRGNISTSAKFNSNKGWNEKFIKCSGFIFSFVELNKIKNLSSSN